MALKAGKNEFANSMAETMQSVFEEQTKSGMPPPKDQMKTLFIAVAEGVVRHLVAHPEAFIVTVQRTGDEDTFNTSVKIASTDTP